MRLARITELEDDRDRWREMCRSLLSCIEDLEGDWDPDWMPSIEKARAMLEEK